MLKSRDDGTRAVRAELVVVLLGLALVLAACYPGRVTGVSELDTVATLFDAHADWGSFQTYAMPEAVVHVVGEGQDSVPISGYFDQDILDLVRSGIESYGYEPELDPENNPPDVVFLVSVAVSEDWVAWRSWDWWDYWSFWPGWGWYPFAWGSDWGLEYACCGSIGVVKYAAGTVFVDMVDPNNAVEGEGDPVIPVYWTAAMNGLLTELGPTPVTLDRLNRVIGQAFDQSPYLQVGE
jgi:hypothetical protein